MERRDTNLRVLVVIFCSLIFFASCSTEEEFFEEELTQEMNGGPSVEAASCDNCNVIPGDLSAYASALEDSKLQTEYLSSEEKDVHEFCDIDFFTTCRGYMVITGPSSKDDRTELRQEKDLSLNEFSSMQYTAIYENVPTSSSTKGVTIAQIHNDYGSVGRPLLRVDIIAGNKVQAHINESFVKNDGSASNDDLVDFSEGDRLYVRMDIKSSGDQVYVYVKNINKGTSGSKTYTVNSNWDDADGQYYYKTGAYTQVAGLNTRVSYSHLDFYY